MKPTFEDLEKENEELRQRLSQSQLIEEELRRRLNEAIVIVRRFIDLIEKQTGVKQKTLLRQIDRIESTPLRMDVLNKKKESEE